MSETITDGEGVSEGRWGTSPLIFDDGKEAKSEGELETVADSEGGREGR